MKMLSTCLLLLALSPMPVLANHHEGSGACKSDVEKFCKDVKKGHGAIIQCLKEHKDEVSAECKAEGEKMKDKMKAAHEACESDIAKFCKDEKPGHGAIMKCLKAHKDELSQACKDANPHKK